MIINCTDIGKNAVGYENADNLMKEAFFFDIETSGLSHKNCSIISITTLFYENNTYKIYQLFLEHIIDEKEMLQYFKELIKHKKYAVTYNGNTFDIPFITNKSLKLGVELNFDEYIKIDLYNDLRHIKNKIAISDLKLKTVEEFFNIKRNDTISGQDVVVLYEAYKIEPRKEFVSLILQHNYEDVYNLPVLLNKIYNLYDVILSYENLTVKINYKDFVFKKNILMASFYIISDLKRDFINRSLNYDLKIDIKSQVLDLSLPLNLFKNDDIKEFYYVDNNDYRLQSYTGIRGIKNNLIPLKFNSTICNNNLLAVTKKILNSIFA